uniref:Uncharacterized protein n=1 Tax=Cacopsylla melanoneura TaxID=428564 RepID=A0A8D8XIP8_9HEMI
MYNYLSIYKYSFNFGLVRPTPSLLCLQITISCVMFTPDFASNNEKVRTSARKFSLKTPLGTRKYTIKFNDYYQMIYHFFAYLFYLNLKDENRITKTLLNTTCRTVPTCLTYARIFYYY